MFRLLFISLLIGISAASGSSQKRVQWHSFSFTEENDFFNAFTHGKDRYYTQGVKLEFCYQVAERKILEKLVIPASDDATNVYSVSAFQKIYTPKNSDKYFYAGDRPYAGSLVFTEGLESYDSLKQLRVFSRLDAGVIGPAAMAEATQDLFHRIIGNNAFVGWDSQLRNDIYLNYFIQIEKAITPLYSKVRLEWKTEFNLGTALISTVPGFNIEYGNWYQRKKHAFQIFFRPEVRIVAFNAVLQGGIINQNFTDDFYTQFLIDDIKTFVFSQSAGIRYRYRNMEIMYRQVTLTREFTGQLAHFYGSVYASFPLGGRRH